MSDSVLTVLKFCLLALLYLFLARVVWIVARELRGTPEPVPAPPPAPVAPPKAKGSKNWRLVVQIPETERGRTYAIDGGDVTIGRGGGCTVVITFDTFVSQVHGHVFERGSALWVEDLGSTNGTLVNGDVIPGPTEVRRGDRVQMGETVFEVQR